jgi:hypothetical protein
MNQSKIAYGSLQIEFQGLTSLPLETAKMTMGIEIAGFLNQGKITECH